ncbi:hypothetical protein M0R45_002167 [Rubus argutus]|uniref:Uncharacterized protein n=1 Tax=Rubus argutus TaxID=59490 RepID=A0AAW1VDS7_RUBAR
MHGPSLGPSHSESLKAATSLITARCDHEKALSADDCIMDVIGKNNSEHFFVATQQADLRKRILKIPGVSEHLWLSWPGLPALFESSSGA